jgi:hypothetical protein
MFLIERYPYINPHHHKISDTVQTIDIEFLAANTETILILAYQLAMIPYIDFL